MTTQNSHEKNQLNVDYSITLPAFLLLLFVSFRITPLVFRLFLLLLRLLLVLVLAFVFLPNDRNI